MGCLGKILTSILGLLIWVFSWIAWLLGWLSWAVFKILYLVLLILCLFCSTPPAPADSYTCLTDGNVTIDWTALTKAAESGSVEAQFMLAKKCQEYAERDDMKTTIGSLVTGMPEYFLREDADTKDEFAKQAEHWYGRVADQGYMLGRYEQWWMVLTRWERNVELWCWAGEKSYEAYEKT